MRSMSDPQGHRLREIREAQGLSRRDLAVALDLTEDAVGRLEREAARPIPSKHIPALTQLLRVETDYLMGWDRIPAKAGAPS